LRKGDAAMRHRPGTLLVAAVAAALGLLGAAATAPGQTPATYKAPRTADGKPNLNGIWQANNTAHWDLEAHQSAAGPIWQLGAGYAIPGGLGVVEGNTIPYKPDALAKKKQNFAKRLELDPEMRCFLPGTPRGMYMPYPFQIIQSQKHIMMVFEFAGAVRTIYMADQTEAPADSWMGWSNGKWEGETLVIDTTGFNGMAWFDRAGNYASENLRVVERISARSAETLNYEATIEDATVFTKPWKIRMPLYRRVEPNVQLAEFRCVEFGEDLVYGHLYKEPKK
jgi:hypothetical protein